jgi:hypothetical protein
MTAKVFESALGIAAPWAVATVEFDEAAVEAPGEAPGRAQIGRALRDGYGFGGSADA